MKKRLLYLSIFICSILGLFIVQYKFLKIGLGLAKIQFEQKVEKAAEELKNDLKKQNELSFLIAQSYQETGYFKLSQDSLKHFSHHFLGDLITKRLAKNKIDTNFAYQLFSKDSLINLESIAHFNSSEPLIIYSIEMEGYLPETLQKKLILQLKFQDLNTYFLSQIIGLVIPSLVFVVLIVIAMVYVLRLFIVQRNLNAITTNFINNLTHELKTPVFSIGLATKILEEDIPREKMPIIDQIKKQVHRLNQHIDQVLELASLETKHVLNLQKIDLRPELLKWCQNFEETATLEHFEFQYTLEKGSYPMKLSIAHFENAINNLIDNAKKYSENPHITLNAYTSDNSLTIEIIDNGKGIAQHDKKRIFEKFYRVSEGDLHKVKGYGLGLSYVKEIIKRHDGRIIVDSELNIGTKITILMPLYA